MVKEEKTNSDFIMEELVRYRLNDETISSLKTILEVCEEKGKTDMIWKERVNFVEEILITKIENIFN